MPADAANNRPTTFAANTATKIKEFTDEAVVSGKKMRLYTRMIILAVCDMNPATLLSFMNPSTLLKTTRVRDRLADFATRE